MGQDYYENEIQPTIEEITSQMRIREFERVILTSRNASRIVHALTSHAKIEQHNEIWMEELPSWSHREQEDNLRNLVNLFILDYYF